MARQHYIQPSGVTEPSITVRLGASAAGFVLLPLLGTAASMLVIVVLSLLTGFAAADFGLYLVKTLVLVLLLTLLRASVARIRMDQMLNFCWMVMTPMAIIQIVVNLFLRGGLGL